MRGLVVVGEQPGNGRSGLGPLSGDAGRRLCRIVGVSFDEWLRLPRVNVFTERQERWDYAAARFDATELRLHFPVGQHFLLCGRRVAAAFGVPRAAWFSTVETPTGDVATVIPHPSGRSRVWNDPAVRRRARRVLRPLLTTAPESTPQPDSWRVSVE